MMETPKKTIGILGGMGPLATVELFRLIVCNTDSKDDQGHIHILIDNNTQIPDRTAAILNNDTSPVSELTKSASLLKKMGADFLAIPCNTSHYYLDLISKNAQIEIINMIDLTAKYAYNFGIKSIGLLATSGSIKTKVYENTLKSYGISTIYPSENEQRDVMEYIYKGIKAGNLQYNSSKLEKIVDGLMNNNAERIILGCTELSLGIDTYLFKQICIDPMFLLAKEAINKAGYKFKQI